MALDKVTQKAVRTGRAQAVAVVERRTRVLKRRQVLVARQRRARAPAVAPVAPKLRAAAGPPSVAGVLVAEGDSWFDYPFVDVLSVLEDDYGYDVESVAHKGDRVEDMAYEGGQLDEFSGGSRSSCGRTSSRERSCSRAAATTLRVTSSACC
jgi:hypothetical protein